MRESGAGRALSAFLSTVDLIEGADAVAWRTFADEARGVRADQADAFFASRLGVASNHPAAKFTAYYEPELAGALRRGGLYQTPVLAPPPGLSRRRPAPPRAEIEAGALEGTAEVLVWLADPVEAFFLHIQGSGRVRLQDGGVLRIGYAAQNHRPYRAIGRILVERGEMTVEQATGDGIKAWLREDPVRGAALMNENPSYIFFRIIEDLRADQGPIGAMGRPLTPGASIAVDSAHHTMGALFLIEGPEGWDYAVAQDVGGAIKGAGRADLFLGAGDDAGRRAGEVNKFGRLARLGPRGAAGV